jgi:hypothetical protein
LSPCVARGRRAVGAIVLVKVLVLKQHLLNGGAGRSLRLRCSGSDAPMLWF